MSKRTANQVLGAIGEAEAVVALLRTGAAINHLAGDDSGWDLHLHLPDKPLPREPNRLPSRAWELSGRTAHVQVKKVTSKTLPALSLGTVQGWLTGTAAGTPTMLLIVPGKGVTDQAVPEPSFATPATLRKWMPKPSEWPASGRKPVSKKALYPLSDDFGYVLEAWSRHPNVVMRLREFDRVLATGQRPTDEQLLNWIGSIAAGYFNHAGVRGDDFQSSWWWAGGGEAIAHAVLAATGRSAPYRDEMLLQAEQAIAAEAYGSSRWHEGLPAATYTLHTDPALVLRDLEAMVKSLFSCVSM